MRYTLLVGLVLFVIGASVLVWLLGDRFVDDCTVLQTIDLSGSERLEIVDDVCKEGLPHTTDKRTIRMVRSIWEGKRRDDVLRHERVHLKQKQGLAGWYEFYRRAWDYECLPEPTPGLPAELKARLRPNPDTADAPWALWRRRWLFFPAFKPSAPTSLKEAEVLVWDTESHRLVGLPEEWLSAFCGSHGCPHQYEHPHEISAEWYTDKVRLPSDAPAAGAFFAWMK